jgi:predicted ribosome quality control (RQC) complex YloA/Tae2 family protein
VDVFVSEAERKSAEKSMLKKRVQVNKKHEKASQKALKRYESSIERYEEKAKSVDTSDRHASRDLERLEDRRQRAALKYEKEVGKAQKNYKKNDKEERSIRRIGFLVIVPKSKAS